MKERARSSVKVYHICETNDIKAFKEIERDERMRAEQIPEEYEEAKSESGSDNNNFTIEPVMVDDNDASFLQQMKRRSTINSMRPSAKYFGPERGNEAMMNTM